MRTAATQCFLVFFIYLRHGWNIYYRDLSYFIDILPFWYYHKIHKNSFCNLIACNRLDAQSDRWFVQYYHPKPKCNPANFRNGRFDTHCFGRFPGTWTQQIYPKFSKKICGYCTRAFGYYCSWVFGVFVLSAVPLRYPAQLTYRGKRGSL